MTIGDLIRRIICTRKSEIGAGVVVTRNVKVPDHHGLGSVVGDARKRQTDDGGIGGLTPGEEAELSDLLNGPHKLCECGEPGCGCPIFNPNRLPS